jgi:hypothetical protein
VNGTVMRILRNIAHKETMKKVHRMHQPAFMADMDNISSFKKKRP